MDGVSSRVGMLLQAHRSMMTEVLLRWSTDQDFRIRRCAITSQLKAKAPTDPEWVAGLSPLSRKKALRHLEPRGTAEQPAR